MGLMSSYDALNYARKQGLDLLCVAPNMVNPVCKILNYGKYKFEQEKRAKEAKKKSIKIETKEIQISYAIAKHDMEVKAKSAKRFLDDGNIVRVVMRLKGREVSLIDFAKTKFQEFLSLCGEFQFKKNIFVEGRDVKAIIEKRKK